MIGATQAPCPREFQWREWHSGYGILVIPELRGGPGWNPSRAIATAIPGWSGCDAAPTEPKHRGRRPR